MINKKAQIATAMLVIIAIVFSAAALFAMASFKNNLDLKSAELNKMANDLEFIQKYIASQSKEIGKVLITTCKDCSDEQIKQTAKKYELGRAYRFQNEGNFFAKIRKGDFMFTKETAAYKLQVKDLSIKVSSNYNELNQNFEICQEFDETGKFLKEC